MNAPLIICVDGVVASVSFELDCYGAGFTGDHSAAMREVLAVALTSAEGIAPTPEFLKALLDASQVLCPTPEKSWRVARVASQGFGFSVTASSAVWARFSVKSVAGYVYTYIVDCAA